MRGDAIARDVIEAYVEVVSEGIDIFVCEASRDRNVEIWRELCDMHENAMSSLLNPQLHVGNHGDLELTSVTPNIRMVTCPEEASTDSSTSICWKTTRTNQNPAYTIGSAMLTNTVLLLVDCG